MQGRPGQTAPKPRWSRLLAGILAAPLSAWAGADPTSADPAGASPAIATPAGATPAAAVPGAALLAAGSGWPAALLGELRPDYRRYISDVRPAGPQAGSRATTAVGGRPVYMALVRPGANDLRLRSSAPYAGQGVRNDVLYDRLTVGGTRSAAWLLLLLDHEYFHARHLAGATSLPLPRGVPAEIERHFFEAAAWGFSVGEARAGRYPGLREDEFREALDRYGDHYAALRSVARGGADRGFDIFPDLLRLPPRLITTSGSRPSGDPARPSGPDRSPGTP